MVLKQFFLAILDLRHFLLCHDSKYNPDVVKKNREAENWSSRMCLKGVVADVPPGDFGASFEICKIVVMKLHDYQKETEVAEAVEVHSSALLGEAGAAGNTVVETSCSFSGCKAATETMLPL